MLQNCFDQNFWFVPNFPIQSALYLDRSRDDKINVFHVFRKLDKRDLRIEMDEKQDKPPMAVENPADQGKRLCFKRD